MAVEYNSVIMTDSKYDIISGFEDACKGGRVDLVDLMITCGADNFNRGLQIACRYGHVDIVNLMINHGASSWNLALISACNGGHMELAELMIYKGASNFNDALVRACNGGHMELAKLMVNHGAFDFKRGFRSACRIGHQHLAELMIYIDYNDTDDFGEVTIGTHELNDGLHNAHVNGHIKLFDFLISHGSDYYNYEDIVNYIDDKKKTINVIMGSDIGSLVTKYLWP